MAFNINQFRDHFSRHQDFAKSSRFDVRISPPAGLGYNTFDLRFQCEASELPGYNINTVDGRYYGVASPVASVASFNDITLTFICAGDFWEKRMFDKWMNLIIPFNNYNPEYRDNYVSPKIEINQFADYANGSSKPIIIYTASLYNAFPVTIAPLQMNWADDGIHRLSVTFKYEYWITGDLEKQGKAYNINDLQEVVPSTRKSSGSTPPNSDGKSTSNI
jgi:hypothetical protein